MPNHSFHIEKSIKYIAIPLYTLAAICFMIYTTQQSYTFADNDEDLGYDITSANASVTVGTACTLTGTVTAPHTATIANGINSTDIGTTVLNTTCNDTGGYALYAIGFAGDEYGATDLSYTSLDGTTTNTSYNIPTGTATSGNASNWSMKLSPVAGTTTATIENNYSSYSIVPDDYTKVATLNTVTDPGSSTAGSSVSTTYQAYISPTQPAGTYTGKVKYTLVHPSTAPKPEKPVYMQDTATIKSKLINEGDTMQAVDSRDGKSYWITKLADGNIWMTQNLDLDLSTSRTLTPANTNIITDWTPANNTVVFAGTTAEGWEDDYRAPRSADPGELYFYSSGTVDDDTQYTSLAACQAAHPDCSMHNHAGNYYNWPAAVASNNTSELTTDYSNAPGSICPAGWRLPTGRNSDNTATSRKWNALLVAEGVMTKPTGFGYAANGFNAIRTAPLWLIRFGNINGTGSLDSAGMSATYQSSTASSNLNVYGLLFSYSNVFPAASIGRDDGCLIRCLVQ